MLKIIPRMFSRRGWRSRLKALGAGRKACPTRGRPVSSGFGRLRGPAARCRFYGESAPGCGCFGEYFYFEKQLQIEWRKGREPGGFVRFRLVSVVAGGNFEL